MITVLGVWCAGWAGEWTWVWTGIKAQLVGCGKKGTPNSFSDQIRPQPRGEITIQPPLHLWSNAKSI